MAEEELSDSELNEVEAFDEYNPHPYQGGYDIESTYGKPLPATPDICYPRSSAVAPAPTPARLPAALPEPASQENPPPPRQDPGPELQQLLPAPPSLPPPSLPDDVSGGPAVSPAATDPWPYSDPHGNWYVAARLWSSGCGNSCCCGVGRNCKDGMWQLDAADYLFGYLPTWGSKRAETHTYANLNYAYERRRREQAVSVVVEAASNHAVFSDSWFPYDDYLPKEETHRELLEWTHAYERYSSEKPVSVEVQPYQLYNEASFSPVYEEQAYPQNMSQYALKWYQGNIDVKDEPSLPGYQYAYKSGTFHNQPSVELKACQNKEAICHNEVFKEESCHQVSHSYALDWYMTEKLVEAETNISISNDWIYQNSYQEDVHQYSDGCYPHKLLGSERSVSFEVQPVLSQPIYHSMYQEEKYPSSDGSHVYENSGSFYVDNAESLWSQLVNGHKDVTQQQQLPHMCEFNHEQQVRETPDPYEPAWF